MRTRALSTLLLVLALAVAAPRARAEAASAGAQPFSFLGLDSSARAAALGGAYTAISDDANALQYNPAGLGRLTRNEASFMHNLYFQSAAQDHAAVAFLPGFGLSADVLNYGTLTRTTYSSPDGNQGTFSISDTALSAGYGRAFGPLALGAAGKWLRESNDGTVGTAVAADAGALLDVPGAPGLRLGAAAQNIGGRVRFQSDGEALPATVRAGAAWSFAAFGQDNVLAVDGFKEGTDRARLSAGAETVAGGSLALRAGFTTRNDAGIGLSAGVGWRGQAWAIDYALAPYGDLGLTHRVGLSYRWGGRDAHEPPPDPLIERALRSSRGGGERPARPIRMEIGLGGDAGPGLSIPPDQRIAKARKFVDDGRLDEAALELSSLDRALGPDDPNRASFNEARGRLLRARNDLKGARAAYEESLRLAIRAGDAAPWVADAYEGMGLTLEGQGDFDYAAKFLRKAYALNPTQRLLDLVEECERRKAK